MRTISSLILFFCVVTLHAQWPDSLTGKWHRANYHAQGELIISDHRDSGFYASVSVFNGSHSGYVEGHADIVEDEAVMVVKHKGLKNDSCTIRIRPEGNSLHITEEGYCTYFRGMRVSFYGTFTRNEPEAPSLRDREVMSWWKERRFKRLTGDTYSYFVDVANDVQPIREDLQVNDKDPEYKEGYHLGIPGLYTIQEGVIYIGKRRKFWAAVIVPGPELDFEVHYFTNSEEWKGNMPPALKKWHSRFAEYPVVYRSKD